MEASISDLVWARPVIQVRAATKNDSIAFNAVAVGRIPQNHASPDAGYSVDILDPILQYTPLFRFTQSTGFALFSSVTGVLASSIPIDLNLRTHFRRKLRDTSGSSGMYGDLSSYSQMVPPAFPSRDAVRAGLIRDIGVWQSRCADAVSSVHLQGDHLTASTFILQPRRMDRSNGQKSRNDVSQTTAGRSSLSPTMSANGVAYITQPTTDAAAHTEPALLNGPNGGSQLLRIIMQGIGTILPAAFQETLLGEEGVPEDEDQEIFYPVQGPLRDKVSPGTPLTDKCTADSLRGLWVGTYSTHGYELGIISIRYIWTKIHLADEIELEQIYDDPASADDADNAMPMFSREPLQVNLEGSIRRRRAIVEFVKLTGDANVPAVSACVSLTGDSRAEHLLAGSSQLGRHSADAAYRCGDRGRTRRRCGVAVERPA